MAAPLRIAINGKFLAAAPTGVHRVAAELTHALAAIARDTPDRLDAELWVPRDAEVAAKAYAMPTRVIRPFVHIPWEQLSIPWRDPGRLLLNLCNIGPVLRPQSMTMIHDAQVYLTPQSYSRPFRLWYKTVQPLLARTHRHLFAVSDFSRTEIARTGLCPPERISVIHNGVDHMLRVVAEPGVLARLDLSAHRYVVALASTQAHKNIGLLGAAFGQAALAGVRLVLVGGEGAEAFAARGIALPADTIFAGRVSDGELRALYESALCLAFPSRTEGFGLPPLEAMLVGCPAVVAPRGALPEVCGDAGLYAGPDDPAGWAAQIARLAADAEWRAARSALGRAHAERFTWAVAAQNLLRIVMARRSDAADPSPEPGGMRIS